jgi:hypothetical protein
VADPSTLHASSTNRGNDLPGNPRRSILVMTALAIAESIVAWFGVAFGRPAPVAIATLGLQLQRGMLDPEHLDHPSGQRAAQDVGVDTFPCQYVGGE